jgi:hypothetical protein
MRKSMRGVPVFSMLEAAYNLSAGKGETLEAIAQAATRVVSRGAVAVCTYDVALALK